MEELIVNYLNKTYFLDFSSFRNYKLKFRHNNTQIAIRESVEEAMKIFDAEEEFVIKLLLEWIEKESIILNNILVESGDLDVNTMINLSTKTITNVPCTQ